MTIYPPTPELVRRVSAHGACVRFASWLLAFAAFTIAAMWALDGWAYTVMVPVNYLAASVGANYSRRRYLEMLPGEWLGFHVCRELNREDCPRHG